MVDTIHHFAPTRGSQDWMDRVVHVQMIGRFEKRPFYWLDYRLSDAADAEWYQGRVLVIGGELWLNVEPQDAAASRFRQQVLLDQQSLTPRYDQQRYSDAAGGGTYFVHQGVLREKQASGHSGAA